MAGAHANRVKETSTSTGTGNLTLAGAETGYRTFDSAFGTTTPFKACIEAVDGSGVPTGEWEVAVCYLSSSTTLVRDIFMDSSTGSTVNFSAGTKFVFNVFSALGARKSTHGFDLQYGMP